MYGTPKTTRDSFIIGKVLCEWDGLRKIDSCEEDLQEEGTHLYLSARPFLQADLPTPSNRSN